MDLFSISDRFQRRCRAVALAGALYALLAGIGTLIGWSSGIYRLIDWDNDGITMKANNALAGICAGSAILLILLRPRWRMLALLLGCVVASIGLATLLEHVAGLNLHIDTMLFDERPGSPATAAPGRMGPISCISYFCIGSGIALIASGWSARRAAQALGLVTLTITGIPLVGYLFGADFLYTIPKLTGIALQTASLIFALALSLIALVPEHGLIATLGRDDSGGMLLRRMLLPVVVLPLVLGWLRVRGQELKLYDTAFGTAAFAFLMVLSLSALLTLTARKVGRIERERRESESRFQGALSRRVAEQSALYEFTNRLHRAGSLAEIHEAALDAILSALQCDRASVLLYDNSRIMRFVASRGLTPEYRAAAEGHSPWKYGTAHAQPVTISDLAQADIAEPLRSVINDAGIRALGFIPLVADGELLGKFMIYFDTPHEFGRDELDLALTIARQLASGVQRARAEEQRRSTESALRMNEERLRLATQTGKVGIWDWDIIANRVSWTDSLYDLHGVTKEQFDGTVEGFASIVHPEDRQRVAHAIERSLAGEGSYELELRAQRPSGEVVYLFTSAHVVRENGKPIRMIGATVDISELKRTEQALLDSAKELRFAKEAAEAASVAKDNFLATLSHELRTPLTPVLATLSAWETTNNFPSELRDDMQVVRRNLDLEARLIDDLLDLTRIVKGKIALNFEILDLHQILGSVIEICGPDIRAKKLDVRVATHAQEHLVRADPGRLQQALWNVLKNGVKFSRDGGRLDISTRDDGDRVQVIIRDQGIGIPPEVLPRLFKPFEQGTEEGVKRYGGLGLGLSITRSLINAQGGEISAESAGSGKGAAFIITFPTIRIADPQGLKRLPHLREANVDFALMGRVEQRCLRLLLVEDHVDTARVLARLLRGNGHEVTLAETVRSALSALASQRFDIVVSDIGLPDGSGIDLVRQIRTSNDRVIPAVALTGFGMEEDVARCHQAGFDEHLTKPVNFQKLEETIQRVAGGNPPHAHATISAR